MKIFMILITLNIMMPFKNGYEVLKGLIIN